MVGDALYTLGSWSGLAVWRASTGALVTRYFHAGDGPITNEGLVPVNDTVFIEITDSDQTEKGIVTSRALVALAGNCDLGTPPDGTAEQHG